MLKAIFLDLDGTVYTGSKAINGARETIRKLQEKYAVFFVSNASMRTRTEQAQKLKTMGIHCKVDHMYNTAYATANYIKRNFPHAKVLVLSEGGLQKELKQLRIVITNNECAAIVATGLDTKLTFKKLTTALRALLNGAIFIASNVDRRYPTEKGILPGSGTIAAFLEYGSEKKPMVIGKPNAYLFESILKEHRLKSSEVLVVGDNYETDICGAHNLKIKSVLVLSGLAKKQDIKKWKVKPDYVIRSIMDLSELLACF